MKESMLKHILYYLMVMVLLTACADLSKRSHQNLDLVGNQEYGESLANNNAEGLMIDNIPPYENEDFDEGLFRSMTKELPEIEARFEKPAYPDVQKMPSALVKWLTVIQEADGTVGYEALANDMSIAGIVSLVSASITIYGWIKDWLKEQQEKQKYKIASKYHARLCYRRDDNMVMKVIFIHKDHYNSNGIAVCRH